MRKFLFGVLFFAGFFTLAFGGEGDISSLIYNESPGYVRAARNNIKKAEQYRKNVEKMEAHKLKVDSRAPLDVQKAVREYNELKKDLEGVYKKLVSAYEKGNSSEINPLEKLSWKIKEKMKIAKIKKSFAYQVDEFEKGVKDFPDSAEMKTLVENVKKDTENYIKYSEDILALQEKQKNIKDDLAKQQTEAQIIRQKEVLKKMKKEYSKNYGE